MPAPVLFSGVDACVQRAVAATQNKEVSFMGERTIWIKPSSFAPEFKMIIHVPKGRDDEEYIDELLDGILNDEFRYNAEWDFIDGLS